MKHETHIKNEKVLTLSIVLNIGKSDRLSTVLDCHIDHPLNVNEQRYFRK